MPLRQSDGGSASHCPDNLVLRKIPRADEMGAWEAAADSAFLAIVSGTPGSACNAPSSGRGRRPARQAPPNTGRGLPKGSGPALRHSFLVHLLKTLRPLMAGPS